MDFKYCCICLVFSKITKNPHLTGCGESMEKVWKKYGSSDISSDTVVV